MNTSQINGYAAALSDRGASQIQMTLLRRRTTGYFWEYAVQPNLMCCPTHFVSP